MTTVDVLIAGAGIIGLSCALELRARGCRVTVLDRDQPMRGASWAAAGMLAAHDPENPAALLPLAERSLALYGAYLDRVRALSGHPVPLRTTTALQAIAPHAPASHAGRLLSPADALALLPGLRTAGTYRFLELAEASLDPRDLCHALPLAAVAAGVVLHAGVAVEEVIAAEDAVEVRTAAGSFSAGAFLNCCGAWASQLQPSQLQEPSPEDPDAASAQTAVVFPRKGQMAVVGVDPAALPIVLRSPEIYLVPRGDGRVVVGATVENAGFDTAVHSETLHALLARAASLWPPIADAPILDSWAGLRPATEDGLPLLGRLQTPRCFVAGGHFRNGILLAPATADVMAEWITGHAPAIDLAPFSPGRFTPARVM